MPRGRPPIPTALHAARGTWRRDRHGPKPVLEAPPAMHTAELTDDERREREEDADRRLRAIMGEAATRGRS
jgi:hypothetical protein